MNQTDWLTADVLAEVVKTPEYKKIISNKDLSQSARQEKILVLAQRVVKNKLGIQTKIVNGKLVQIK